MSDYHISVLLQEAIDGLNISHGKKYIDATLGGGGHSLEIVACGGIVLGIDQDEEAIKYVKKNLKLKVVQGNFAEIGKIARENGFERVDGILFDLGVSGHQLESADRGFSFLHEGPLDMRMDTGLSVQAKDLVNGLNKGELALLFTKYGEEPFAKRIAERIVAKRFEKQIETTRELGQIVASVYPKGDHRVHPATKVFQALRIAVNDEIVSLETALAQVLELLKSNGRIVIISFHSLEDRMVKHTFLEWEKEGFGKVITKKPIEPNEKEVEKNKKSRSAKMRIFQKL